MTREQLLKIENLSVSVEDTPILNSIKLNVGARETHVLMGPNGAGKSTLGRAIMGDPVYEIDGGSIIFDDEDITELAPDKRSHAGIFFSFQAPVEIPGVPVSSFLRAATANRGKNSKESNSVSTRKSLRKNWTWTLPTLIVS